MKFSGGNESEVLKNCSISEVILQFESNKYFVNQIIVCVINSVFIIFTVGLNGSSILTILKTPALKETVLLKVCYFLILVQSCIQHRFNGWCCWPAFTYLFCY